MRALILAVLLSSCSATWHLNRAVKKDPSILIEQVIRIDTFTVRDTFTYHDTFVTNSIDTITIDTGSVQVRIIREHDVIRTTVTQKPDTAYITIEKQLPPRVINKQSWFRWWYLLPFFIIWALDKLK